MIKHIVEDKTLGMRGEELEKKIFGLLKTQGALCPSQISERLGASISAVKEALDALVADQLVELRSDLGDSANLTHAEVPYGLNRGKFKVLSPGFWFRNRRHHAITHQ